MEEEWTWKGTLKKVKFYNGGGWHVWTFYYFLGIPVGMGGPNGSKKEEFAD